MKLAVRKYEGVNTAPRPDEEGGSGEASTSTGLSLTPGRAFKVLGVLCALGSTGAAVERNLKSRDLARQAQHLQFHPGEASEPDLPVFSTGFHSVDVESTAEVGWDNFYYVPSGNHTDCANQFRRLQDEVYEAYKSQIWWFQLDDSNAGPAPFPDPVFPTGFKMTGDWGVAYDPSLELMADGSNRTCQDPVQSENLRRFEGFGNVSGVHAHELMARFETGFRKIPMQMHPVSYGKVSVSLPDADAQRELGIDFVKTPTSTAEVSAYMHVLPESQVPCANEFFRANRDAFLLRVNGTAPDQAFTTGIAAGDGDEGLVYNRSLERVTLKDGTEGQPCRLTAQSRNLAALDAYRASIRQYKDSVARQQALFDEQLDALKASADTTETVSYVLGGVGSAIALCTAAMARRREAASIAPETSQSFSERPTA